jgi:hypothetical protein
LAIVVGSTSAIVLGMTVGAELRDARLRAGLSQQDISQRTKIQLPKIEALEADQFEHLPQGIYLDGLIRAYAAEVGLDGREVLSRFHRDYVAVPPAEAAAEFPSETEDFPSENEDTVADARVTKADESRSIPPPSEVRVNSAAAPAIPVASEDVIYPDMPLDTPSGILTERASAPPRARLGRLALPVLALLAAVALGAYISDASRPFTEREDIQTPAVSSEASGAANASSDPSALPLSGVSSAPDAAATSPASGAEQPTARVAGTPPADIEGASATGTRLERAAEAPPARNPKPAAKATPAGKPTSTASADTANKPSAPAPASGLPITGFWTLDTRVETSSVRDFEGLQLGYRLELQLEGNRITGRGIKTVENGKAIAAAGQTPITLVGRMDRNRLTLSFIESGTRRESTGKMILELHEDGVLRGRFSSDAARSTGTVEGRRPEG